MISWTFYGYSTPNGRRDVQEWFDGLPEEDRDEARDVLRYLRLLPRHLWIKPEFGTLDHDVSEIRFRVNVPHSRRIYRIYGAFWPPGKRYVYTFLIAKDKKVSNDRRGKREAVRRLKKLRSKEATIHEFEFEKGSDSQAWAREGR